MIIKTKKGDVEIDETMRSPCVTNHIPSRKIETKKDWEEAKKQAEAVVKWWDENNGKFNPSVSHEEGFAIHHAQVCKADVPWNFFVLDYQFTQKGASKLIKKKDRKQRDLKNKIFPAQVIYNPEIVTALYTFLDYVPDTDPKREWKKSALPNIYTYKEACMSHPNRKPKNFDRFYKIVVKYQVIKPKLGGLSNKIVDVEETIEGFKAHIFQHEVDHARGWDIYFGDGKRKNISINDRELELGYTRDEVEKFTYERLKELAGNIKKQGITLVERVEDEKYFRIKNGDDVVLPDEYKEVDNFELYNWDGTIKPPHDKAEMIKGEKKKK